MPATMDSKSSFGKIYEQHSWKGDSKSGPGSDQSRTVQYRAALQHFMRAHQVKSVVDLGCGDWASSRLIDWSGIDYLGIDVVPDVIEANRRKFGAAGIRFETIDAASDPLPSADLLISKEVLQHLPNADVMAILGKLPGFRWAILTNDVEHATRNGWRWWSWKPFRHRNTDTDAGGYRLLALREGPFNLSAEVLLTYANRYKNMRWQKEVLLWRRNDGR
jgi:SAM-dependent methyltransferase